jgi:hypothetical protein
MDEVLPTPFAHNFRTPHPIEQAARDAGISIDDALAIVQKRKHLRQHEKEFVNTVTLRAFETAIASLENVARCSIIGKDRVEAAKAISATYLKLQELLLKEHELDLAADNKIPMGLVGASLWSFTGGK